MPVGDLEPHLLQPTKLKYSSQEDQEEGNDCCKEGASGSFDDDEEPAMIHAVSS